MEIKTQIMTAQEQCREMARIHHLYNLCYFTAGFNAIFEYLVKTSLTKLQLKKKTGFIRSSLDGTVMTRYKELKIILFFFFF